MPYLSRIWLNPLRTRTQRLLRNPQAMHAAVLGGLPAHPAAERVLWRLESTHPHRAELLVLTRTRPSWEHLVEQAGWPGADEPQALAATYEPLLRRLAPGQEYAFRLCANTVAATRHPTAPSPAQQRYLDTADRPRGVRVPQRTLAHQLTWFNERVESWGFTPAVTTTGAPQVHVTGRARTVFDKRTGDGGSRRVVLQTATYEGRLRIVNPTAATTTLLDGVGKAKAYGCGLLTLAPLSRP